MWTLMAQALQPPRETATWKHMAMCEPIMHAGTVSAKEDRHVEANSSGTESPKVDGHVETNGHVEAHGPGPPFPKGQK